MNTRNSGIFHFRLAKAIIAMLGMLTLTFGLSACAPAGGEPVEVSADTVVIDVRTPEEFAGGHLEGALLLDLNSGEFAAALPTLDPGAEYLIYCRSGNRAGQAISLMEKAGFTNLANLGSAEQASQATGLPLVAGDE